jgi:hypothetical protein
MPIRFYPPHLHPLPPKGGEEFLKSALYIDFGVIWIIIESISKSGLSLRACLPFFVIASVP